MTPEKSEYTWPIDRMWQDSQTSMPTDIFRIFFIVDSFQSPLTDTSLQIFHFFSCKCVTSGDATCS